MADFGVGRPFRTTGWFGLPRGSPGAVFGRPFGAEDGEGTTSTAWRSVFVNQVRASCLRSPYAMIPEMAKGPSDRFVRMYGSILDTLREMGGEGPAGEVARKVADAVLGDSPERSRELKSGGNAGENEVAWARNNLREAGLIDGSTRGVWKLTDKGWKTKLTLKEAQELGRHATITARNRLPVVEKSTPIARPRSRTSSPSFRR